MPEMDGFEATRAIREMERSGVIQRRLTVAINSAFTENHDKETCAEVGADYYLAKPMKRSDIEDIILRLVETKGHGER